MNVSSAAGALRQGQKYVCHSCLLKRCYVGSWPGKQRHLHYTTAPVVYPRPDPSVAAALYSDLEDHDGTTSSKDGSSYISKFKRKGRKDEKLKTGQSSTSEVNGEHKEEHESTKARNAVLLNGEDASRAGKQAVLPRKAQQEKKRTVRRTKLGSTRQSLQEKRKSGKDLEGRTKEVDNIVRRKLALTSRTRAIRKDDAVLPSTDRLVKRVATGLPNNQKLKPIAAQSIKALALSAETGLSASAISESPSTNTHTSVATAEKQRKPAVANKAREKAKKPVPDSAVKEGRFDNAEERDTSPIVKKTSEREEDKSRLIRKLMTDNKAHRMALESKEQAGRRSRLKPTSRSTSLPEKSENGSMQASSLPVGPKITRIRSSSAAPVSLTKTSSIPAMELKTKAKSKTGLLSFAKLEEHQNLEKVLRSTSPSASKGVGKLKSSEIKVIDASQLNIAPLQVDQPPVPSLSYGLERVLFNPGVYHMQDPRSRVFNFDPYLQRIMPVSEFDFNALKEYITSSRDRSLENLAQAHGKRYVGSSSSMTGALAHFHFLLSQWREINVGTLSQAFPDKLRTFTLLQRCPSAIFLRWKNGTYAIDADKEFASANILSMLGKSMEKLLTLNTDDYERYRKSSPHQISNEERNAPESFHYSAMGDFLMRSQLDAFDARLPGTGMFDLKTRAVVSIRMDARNYQQGSGYEIKTRYGEWESFEREYFDMIRAAFLKYSLQVRMGRMDGIFVAFHNTERIFGFQYISLPEMDLALHGHFDTLIGDQQFKLSLDLLNKILDKATKKFPEQSLRIHFETRDSQTPFMYIFVEPVTEEQVQDLQSRNDAKIEEFERDILGLARGVTDASDGDKDDNKWADIQAKVQEAMERDERSVDGVSETSGISPLTTEDDEDDDVAIDRDLLHDDEALHGGDKNLVLAAIEDAETYLEDDDERSNDYKPREGDSESRTAEGQTGLVEEETEERDIEGAEEEGDEAHESDNAELDDTEGSASVSATEEVTAPALGAAERTQTLLGESNDLAEPEALAKATAQDGIEHTEDSEADADSEFLDEIDREHTTTVPPESPEILAMTLTIRNKVNDQYVLRPENLGSNDRWSIEYSLAEVPDQARAWSLYRACQLRRKKKLDVEEDGDEDAAANFYIERMRQLSRKGQVWRKEQDEMEEGKPKIVLGKSSPRERPDDQSKTEPES